MPLGTHSFVFKLPLTGTLISVTLISAVVLVVYMAKVRAGPLHVALFATTLIEPELWSTRTTKVFVVETPDQPPGTVQVYDVAPATEATEYVFKLFNPTAIGPEIAAG